MTKGERVAVDANESATRRCFDVLDGSVEK
jgi:hypothetical protein